MEIKITKFSLYQSKNRALKTLRGFELQINTFPISVQHEGEWLPLSHVWLTPRYMERKKCEHQSFYLGTVKGNPLPVPGIERGFNVLSKLLANWMHWLMSAVMGTEMRKCGASFRVEGGKMSRWRKKWEYREFQLAALCSKLWGRSCNRKLTIIRVIKSRRMRWVGHVARMGKRRGVYRVLVGKPERKKPLEDQGVDGKMILRWIFRKWDVGAWTGSSWPRIGTGGGHLWIW